MHTCILTAQIRRIKEKFRFKKIITNYLPITRIFFLLAVFLSTKVALTTPIQYFEVGLRRMKDKLYSFSNKNISLFI